MRSFQIWCEGYIATGNRSGATLLGVEIANTWDEAMEKYMTKNKGRISVREFEGTKVYTDWGCRLFDNESEARKSFG